MKKERIKNIILTALVLLSLVLTGRIWLNENLWPDGYHFFADLDSKFAQLFSGTASEESRNLLSPAHMIAYTVKNSDHASCMLTNTNENYAQALAFCETSIADALVQPDKNISAVDEAAWRNALFTNGMYLDYGAGIPTDVFCAFSGVSAQSAIAERAENIRYVIITAEGNLVSNVAVYLRDTSGNSFKIATPHSKTELTDLLSSLNDFVTPNNRFSFFLGADTATSAMGEVVFAPYLLLTQDQPQLPTVLTENPVFPNGEPILRDDYANQLMRNVSMNPKTAKKYTDADGNIIFLQNHATLKISPNGSIDYTAAAGQSGFNLIKNNTADVPASARAAVNLVYDTYALFSERAPSLFISDFTATEDGFILSLDYNLGGNMVCTDLSDGHAVTIELANGCVQNLTMLMRSYSTTEQQIELPSSFTAVDLMFAQMQSFGGNTIIEDMFVGYNDTGAHNELRPTWFIKLENEKQRRTSQF